jgi:small-conductance mechanosensitive channel
MNRHRLLKGVLSGMLLALAWAAVARVPATFAAAPTTPPTFEAELQPVPADVMLDGEVLFRVHGVSVYPAEQRASAIAARIRAVAADRTVAADALRVNESEFGWDILAGDRPLMTVTEVEARREGVHARILAEIYSGRIAAAITAYRAERTGRALATKTAAAAGATLVAAALAFGLVRVSRRLDALVDRRLRARIHGFETQSFRLVRATQISAVIRGLLSGLRVVGVAAIAYAYLAVVLELFPPSRPLARGLASLFLGPLASMGLAVLDALPNLIFLAILVVMIRYLLRLVRLFFAGVDSGAIAMARFDREWAWPTYRVIRFLTIAFAVVVAYPHIPGSESPAFKGVSIFVGLILSLGSSSFIANVLAGYSMIYRRTFRVGDRIRVGDVTGDVAESGLMVTRVRTPKNEEVVVPNATILSSHVVNYSARAQQGGLILHSTVGIGYETPWRQVEAMLLLAADRTFGLLKDPPPFVLLQSLGDFCVTYEINAYCDAPQVMVRLYTDLHRHILDVFNEYGVQIMTPAYERDPEQPKVVPKADWFASPAKPPNGSPMSHRPS